VDNERGTDLATQEMKFPGDIDPRQLHVDPRKRRGRKPRADLPEPKPTLKAAQPATERRLYKMPISPGIILEPMGDENQWRWTSPHNDLDLWEAQIHAAFGTRSSSLVDVFLRQLKHLCRRDWDHEQQRWKWNETEMNGALALVSDIAPRNSAEAALAAQMVAVHLLSMNLAKEAFNSGGMVMDKAAALLDRLARTYTMQLEALRLGRGGRRPTVRQTITVRRENHVHYHDNRRGGGLADHGAQPHATEDGGTIRAEGAGQPAECAALPSPCEVDGEGVPIPGGNGTAGLPHARRNKQGRAKR
jgi:hypothetical protein